MPAPSAPITPVDTSSFTAPQLAAFSAAAKLGTGVPTFDSRVPADGPAKPATPAKEPAVLSSSNISENVIPDLTKRADTLADKGTHMGQDGNMYYSDSSLVPAPTDAEYNPNTKQWTSGNSSYGTGPQYVTGDDEDSKETNELFDSTKANLDSTTLASITAIQQQYDMLKAQQQDTNARADKTRARISTLGGATRYAPLDASGVALAQTQSGLQEIAKLDADENAAIAQVRQAQQSQNFQLMEKALGIAESKRQEKQDAAAKLADQLSTANAAAAKATAAATQSDQIAQILASGVTDPTDVFDTLRKAGVTITAQDVKSGIDALTPKAAKEDLYKFSTTDVGTLYAAGLSAGDVQAVQDYYNGKGDASILSSLSAAEKAAVNKALTGKAVTGTDDTFKFTPTQKSQLLSGNFTAGDIANMQADVAKYGVDKVTEGMPDAQAKLVKRVLATSDTVANPDGNNSVSSLIDALNSQ